MLPDFARSHPLWEAAFGGMIFGLAMVLAFLVHPLLTRVAKIVTSRTKTTLDDRIVEAISRPVFLFVIVQGVFLALTTSVFLDPWQDYVNKGWLVLMLANLFYALQRIMSAIVNWYGEEVAGKTKSQIDDKLLPLVRRFLTGVIYGIGILLILDNLGVKLSALIAGLGLGGLAVALALQPSLSNFIASAYVVADGTIGVGDFIEIQGGPSGTVTDIGWRTTKILTPMGNMVLIPNSKVADSIITNYHAPTPEINVSVSCGVSYESDLDKVEKITKEVGEEIIRDLSDSVVVKEFKPYVVFRDFGDSNVNFIFVLRAKDRAGMFALTHEMVKRLYTRFTKEGIEINYPVRKVIYGPHRMEPSP